MVVRFVPFDSRIYPEYVLVRRIACCLPLTRRSWKFAVNKTRFFFVGISSLNLESQSVRKFPWKFQRNFGCIDFIRFHRMARRLFRLSLKVVFWDSVDMTYMESYMAKIFVWLVGSKSRWILPAINFSVHFLSHLSLLALRSPSSMILCRSIGVVRWYCVDQYYWKILSK